MAIFARHFSHIFACTVPPGLALGGILFFFFPSASWYIKGVFILTPFYFFAIGWFLNPHLIEFFNFPEVDRLRREIAGLCLRNLIQKKDVLAEVERLGKKDDLVFVRALRPFKHLDK